MDNIWYAFLHPTWLTKGAQEGFPMVIDALEPLTHISNWSRNQWFSFIVNLRYGLPYTTEFWSWEVLTGFRGIGEVSVLRLNLHKKHLRRGGVNRGLEGLKVGLEVLWKSLRGVMGCCGVLGWWKSAFFGCRICHSQTQPHFWAKILQNRGLGPPKMKSSRS